jgi:methyl-accepting chemotaxis protein
MVKLQKLTIATRLVLAFCLLVVMLVMVSALGIVAMTENQRRMEEITSINSVKSRLAISMRDTVHERMIALRNMALLGSAAEMEPDAQRMDQQRKEYAAVQEKLVQLLAQSHAAPADEKALLQKIREFEAGAAPVIAKAKELALFGQSDRVYSVLVDELLPVQTKWMTALGELIRLEEKHSERAARNAQSAYDSARLMMLAISGVAVAVACVVSFVLSRSMLRQLGGELGYAKAVAERIAAGDLAFDVQMRPGDQTSLLAAMKRMRDSLAGIVGQVRRNTDTIADASSEIASGNQDLAARTEEQAGSLRQTSSLMHDLVATVRENTENAALANGMVDEASQAAQSGRVVVMQVVDTMSSIRESAGKIADITSVIDGIAFQTNILALNAAVEAARAGEQGRGFAVVAAEVRALAQRSAGAAKEIKALISNSMEEVEAGSQLTDRTDAAMEKIVESVRRVTQIMTDIFEASRAQSKGIESIGAALSQVDQTTRMNAVLVEQAAASAASLEQHAAELADSVCIFKTGTASETGPGFPMPDLDKAGIRALIAP